MKLMQEKPRKSLTEEQSKSLSGFFEHYIEFVEVELYNSLIENSVGRCEGILYAFLKIVHIILTKEITDEQSKKILGIMAKAFKKYEVESVIKSAHRLKIDLEYQDIDNFIDNNLIILLDTFFVAINDFRQILPKIPLDEDVKQTFNIIDGKAPTFTQALLELNNALAHIAVAMYHKDKQDTKANIKKAKAHLYRGSLDCYKMLIRFLLTSEEKEYILETYKKLRIKEFCELGGDIQDKLTLIDEYHDIVDKILQSQDFIYDNT